MGVLYHMVPTEVLAKKIKKYSSDSHCIIYRHTSCVLMSFLLILQDVVWKCSKIKAKRKDAYHIAEQSKLINIHLCGLKLKESAYY